MFKNNTIEKRVMAVIKAKIEEAQKIFNEAEKDLIETFDNDVKALGVKLEADKEDMLTNHVNKILGKIL